MAPRDPQRRGPLISIINSVTYNIGKHVATILAPMVGNTPRHIQNTRDLVNKVLGLKLDPDETMAYGGSGNGKKKKKMAAT